MVLVQKAMENESYLRMVGEWNRIASRVLDLFGIELDLIDTAARPDLVQAAIAQIDEFYAEHIRRLAESTEGVVDVPAFGDDFASQRSMLLSPSSWHAFLLPEWKRLFSIAHDQKEERFGCWRWTWAPA